MVVKEWTIGPVQSLVEEVYPHQAKTKKQPKKKKKMFDILLKSANYSKLFYTTTFQNSKDISKTTMSSEQNITYLVLLFIVNFIV